MSSVIGLATLRFGMHAAASLKDKRSVSKGLAARIRQRFNVAVAETDTQDSISTLTLGVVCLSNSERHVQSMLAQVVGFVESLRLDADLIDYEVELL